MSINSEQTPSVSAECRFRNRVCDPVPYLPLRFRLSKIKDFLAEMGAPGLVIAKQPDCLDSDRADRF
jgi:hypothetical protein